MIKLAESPRLFVTREIRERLRQLPADPFLRRLQRRVTRAANEYAGSASAEYDPGGYNAHLIRSRLFQKRIWTLLAEYVRTGGERFRDAVVAHVRAMAGWEYWSWIRWREKNPDPESIFDLSYGESGATLALAWDLLEDNLSAEERELFIETARARVLRPFLRETSESSPGCTNWFCHPHTNWNTVCAGGGGMLALVMYEHVPEAKEVFARAEKSIAVLIRKGLKSCGGGWPEGTGYWNYAFRYAFLYLLSCENATGRRHPLMRLRQLRECLEFPQVFCPNGRAAGFNDNDRWAPLPFHLAAARALGRDDVLHSLSGVMRSEEPDPGRPKWPYDFVCWPYSALLLMFYPRRRPRAPRPRRDVLRIYPEMDWGVFADRLPGPGFCVTVRGGSTRVPHANRDLLSWNLVVGEETFVRGVQHAPYLDSTFGSRRWELYDLSPHAKNTVLINGVGLAHPGAVRTAVADLGAGLRGIRMDATGTTGPSRGDGPLARFCGRLFVVLQGRALLVVDRLSANFSTLLESRLHTPRRVMLGENGAVLAGRKHRVEVSYACSVPAGLFRAEDAPAWPEAGECSTMLRWVTAAREREVAMATLLTADVRGSVEVVPEGRGYAVRTVVGREKTTLRLTAKLKGRRR